MRGPPATTLHRQAGAVPAAGDRPPARTDIAIIGGGVIGLSIGWRLLGEGLRVCIFERATAGSGASLAATGMLAPAAELEPGGEAHLPLARESLRLWPGFAARLAQETGQDVDYRREGALLLAQSRDEVERLRFRHGLQQRCGLATEWLDGPACRRLEPALRPNAVAGILCRDDHQVDPPRVVAALRAAFLRAGGTLVEGTEASVVVEVGRAAGVATATGETRAAAVVAAGGAWTALPGLALPLRPLKGQSLALAMDAARPLLTRMVWTEQVHLAPKSDGTLIVGATVEERGFDDGVTAGGVYALLEAARRVLPAIEELPLGAIWSGFRPTTIDDAPILGETPIPDLAIATGHHRNGYLLAPVTAEAIAELVTTGRITGPVTAEAIAELVTTGRITGPAAAFGLGRFAGGRIAA